MQTQKQGVQQLHRERVEEVRVHVVCRKLQDVAGDIHMDRYKEIQPISSINEPSVPCAAKDVITRVWVHKVCPTTGRRSTLGRRTIPQKPSTFCSHSGG